MMLGGYMSVLNGGYLCLGIAIICRWNIVQTVANIYVKFTITVPCPTEISIDSEKLEFSILM